MSAADVAAWLTKPATAAALQLSTKGVERLVAAGQIQQARRPGPKGGALVAVYCPEDVARLASERRTGPPAAFLVPAAAGNGNGHGTALTPQPAGLAPQPPGEDVLRLVFAAALRAVSETSETPTIYVPIAEAARIAGLSEPATRRLVKARGVRTARDRAGLHVHRAELEARL